MGSKLWCVGGSAVKFGVGLTQGMSRGVKWQPIMLTSKFGLSVRSGS